MCSPKPPAQRPSSALPPCRDAGAAAPQAVCRATLSFYHLFLGVLLPTFLSVWYWPPPAASRSAARQGSDGSAALRQGSLAERAAAAVHAKLRFITGMEAAPAVRAILCWYILANCWLLCKVTAFH